MAVSKKNKYVKKSNYEVLRLNIFRAGIVLSFGLILLRAFQIQVLDHEKYKVIAESKHSKEYKLTGERGNIYFQDLKSGGRFPVAINLTKYNVGIDANAFASSNETNKSIIKDFINQNFPDIDKVRLEEEFNKTDNKYYIFARGVSEDIVAPIKDKRLIGLLLEKHTNRIYPEKTLGAHILGFVSSGTGSGQYGLEQYYNDVLKGRDGFMSVEAKDGKGRWIANSDRKKEDAVNGSNLILTIDHTLQFKLEEALADLSEEYKPKFALGAIMDPKTGDIFAMASNPTFDVNDYNKVPDISIYKNPWISNLYEQGSIFKPITVGVGLEKGVITPDTTYEDKGTEKINGFDVSNWSNKTYGTQTMRYSLENSLNLGMIFIQRKLGRDAFVSGIVNDFQISSKTGIDLHGEANNNISNITKNTRDAREINYANASYGQGISMTPIRMLTSFNSIVNGGKIVKPRLVKAIEGPDGQITNIEPEVQGQSMSEDKARVLSEMLVDVVDNGSGKGASIEGYNIGGKTGTGQIAVNGKYIKSGGPTYQSFIEFATLDNPKYTLLISLDSPQGARFSDTSVVPKVKELNEFLINYFLMQPDKSI
ncbi:MAG: hypothetical protein RLZZ223_268 [Candidatus Parcubacteria bacterium]|jgi:cell division protein FtsI/penicillin-binding protein 2